MTFDAIGIAATGLTAHRKWLDAVADNLSNVNTIRPTGEDAFQARYITVTEGSAANPGVYVTGVEYGDPEGRLVYEPDHPLADDDGYVRAPDIDLSEQMGHLILAQRGYQSSAAVVDRAKTAYEAALQIGK